MIVLDTHVWVWWVSRFEPLSQRAAEILHESAAEGKVYVSSVSAWEIVLLESEGRIELAMGVDDWIAQSERLPFLEFVPVDNRIALRASRLPEPVPADPTDRIIVATALTLGAPLLTRDAQLQSYVHLETPW